MTDHPRSHGKIRVLLASGLLLLAGIAGSAAAYTDAATVNLGTGSVGSGIGNPNRFDIAVKDAAGQWQDAATPAAAVVLATTSGTSFSERTALVFTATFLNRDPGISGDLTISLWDPDPSASNELFDYLRFDIFLDGSSTAVVTGATAAQVAAAGIVIADVAPGQTHTVKVSAVIAHGSGIAVGGFTTALGVRAQGASR